MNKKIIRGAIYYADLDPIVEYEKRAYKPVLIIQNDMNSKYSSTIMVAPIIIKSYKGKKYPTHVKVKQFNKLRHDSIISLEQIRTIDKRKIKGYVDMLNKSQMKDVEKALILSFGFSNEYLINIIHNF